MGQVNRSHFNSVIASLIRKQLKYLLRDVRLADWVNISLVWSMLKVKLNENWHCSSWISSWLIRSVWFSGVQPRPSGKNKMWYRCSIKLCFMMVTYTVVY